jgi:hypothetical protein
METTSSFGYWIRRQRKAQDLTQQALAMMKLKPPDALAITFHRMPQHMGGYIPFKPG